MEGGKDGGLRESKVEGKSNNRPTESASAQWDYKTRNPGIACFRDYKIVIVR